MFVLDTIHEELVGVICCWVIPHVVLLTLDIGYQLRIVTGEVGMHDVTPQVTASLTTLPELPNLEIDPLVEARHIIVELGKLGCGM